MVTHSKLASILIAIYLQTTTRSAARGYLTSNIEKLTMMVAGGYQVVVAKCRYIKSTYGSKEQISLAHLSSVNRGGGYLAIYRNEAYISRLLNLSGCCVARAGRRLKESSHLEIAHHLNHTIQHRNGTGYSLHAKLNTFIWTARRQCYRVNQQKLDKCDCFLKRILSY